MDRSRKPRIALLATALAAVFLFGFDRGSCGDRGEGSSGGVAGPGGGASPVVDPCNALDEAACLASAECRPTYSSPCPECACADGELCDADCACDGQPTFAGCVGAPAGCGTACEIWCEYGNVLDENGCALCACNPAPSECAPVLCDVWCEYGHVLDASGCPTCACNPPPADPCDGLSERACNAAPGCRGVYEGGDDCACSPCPPGVECFCDCPTADEGAWLRCESDTFCGEPSPRPPPSKDECATDADCPAGHRCEHLVTCQAIGCPPSHAVCLPESESVCADAQLTADGTCVLPDGTVTDPHCCAAR